MPDFINVQLTRDSNQIATEALERLAVNMEAKGYVGWKAKAPSLLTILIETLAPDVEDFEQVASIVPAAVFRRFGAKLLQLAYNEGTAATATTTWTSVDTAEHTIEAGTQVQQGEYGFYVSEDTKIESGQSSVAVPIVAVAQGSEYNSLTGVLEPVNAIDWLGEVTIIGETSGGNGQETDEEYENRLSDRLTLFGEVLVTAINMASGVKDAPATILPTGTEVGRSTAIDGYDPSTTSFTGTTTNKSTTLSEVSSFAGITVGTELAGTGIPAHTTVVSVNVGAKTVMMSEEATSSNSKESIEALGSYENGKTLTVFVTDKQGKLLPSETMLALKTYLLERARVNDRIFVEPASYSKIYATTKIHMLPGYEEATVIASVKTALEAFLSPLTWANPTHAETGGLSWLNRIAGFNIVRYNTIIGVIESVPGVAYVFPGAEGLKTGFTATPTGTSDLILPGPAPLTETETAALVVTTG